MRANSLSAAFHRRCETTSTDQRVLLGLRAFDPLLAQILAEKLDAQVLTLEQFASISFNQVDHLLSSDKWSAAILCHEPLMIVINPNHAPVRRESDLMHELGHVLLNHPMAQFHPETGLPLRSQVHEEEATFLGSCLQVPRRGLFWAMQFNWSLTKIANHFGASESMVKFRLNMTGALNCDLQPHF